MSENFNPQECRVALLAGGRSSEREISIKSGQGTLKALEEAGFPVTVLDPAKREDLITLIQEEFDVAFLVTHGRYGEDGILQGFLELIDLPYTGPDVWGSALAMNKSNSKKFYEAAGLNTAPSVTVFKDQPYDIDAILAVVGERSFVKAANEGSTLGIFRVEQGADLESAIQQAFEFDSCVLIEKEIKGDEFTIAVLGNEDAKALPVIQIVPSNEYYDFEAKYAPGGSQHLCPAPISDELTALLQESGVKAHKALSLKGVSRTDFIVDADGVAWALETNTLPGMTGTSLLPDAAKQAGMSFADLVTVMVKNAIAAHPKA